MVWQAVVDFFVKVGAWIVANPVTAALTAYSTYSGLFIHSLHGFLQSLNKFIDGVEINARFIGSA